MFIEASPGSSMVLNQQDNSQLEHLQVEVSRDRAFHSQCRVSCLSPQDFMCWSLFPRVKVTWEGRGCLRDEISANCVIKGMPLENNKGFLTGLLPIEPTSTQSSSCFWHQVMISFHTCFHHPQQDLRLSWYQHTCWTLSPNCELGQFFFYKVILPQAFDTAMKSWAAYCFRNRVRWIPKHLCD